MCEWSESKSTSDASTAAGQGARDAHARTRLRAQERSPATSDVMAARTRSHSSHDRQGTARGATSAASAPSSAMPGSHRAPTVRQAVARQPGFRPRTLARAARAVSQRWAQRRLPPRHKGLCQQRLRAPTRPPRPGPARPRLAAHPCGAEGTVRCSLATRGLAWRSQAPSHLGEPRDARQAGRRSTESAHVSRRGKAALVADTNHIGWRARGGDCGRAAATRKHEKPFTPPWGAQDAALWSPLAAAGRAPGGTSRGR